MTHYSKGPTIWAAGNLCTANRQNIRYICMDTLC